MKYLIPILILFMGCATTLPPAGLAQAEMRKADRVIVITDASESLYKKVGQHLSNSGFSISNSDKELGSIQTSFKNYSDIMLAYEVQVNASIQDTAVHFFGKVKIGSTTDEIKNQGMGGSAMDDAWQVVKDLAKNFPHKEIYYSRN